MLMNFNETTKGACMCIKSDNVLLIPCVIYYYRHKLCCDVIDLYCDTCYKLEIPDYHFFFYIMIDVYNPSNEVVFDDNTFYSLHSHHSEFVIRRTDI